jgi:hypothetical protein
LTNKTINQTTKYQVAFRQYVGALVSAALVDEEAGSIAELGDFLEMDPAYVHATLKAQVRTLLGGRRGV